MILQGWQISQIPLEGLDPLLPLPVLLRLLLAFLFQTINMSVSPFYLRGEKIESVACLGYDFLCIHSRLLCLSHYH